MQELETLSRAGERMMVVRPHSRLAFIKRGAMTGRASEHMAKAGDEARLLQRHCGNGGVNSIFMRADKLFLIVALMISFLPITGCRESTFKLANESRLPRWVVLPRGVTRADISITLSYYTSPGGDDAIVTVTNRGGKTIAEVRGKMKCHTSFARYPAYEAVEINGITEVIEHKKMAPIFYVTDDNAIKKMLLARGHACE